MAFLENCVERATALAATCGWLAFGGGAEAVVGIAIGGAGLAAVVGDVVRKHGPESEAALKAIRKRVSRDIRSFAESERWEIRADVHAADQAMERALRGCFLDRRALAASARSRKGFPDAATGLILDKLAQREPSIFGDSGPEVARDFASQVVRAALEAAIENEAYFKNLQPHLLMETLRGLGSLEARVDDLDAEVKKINEQTLKYAIEDVFLALNLMPARLNEAVNRGDTYFGFAEARSAFERLYTTALSVGRDDVAQAVLDFQDLYNGYLSIIRDGIARRATIEQVNYYHENKLIPGFSKAFPDRSSGELNSAK